MIPNLTREHKTEPLDACSTNANINAAEQVAEGARPPEGSIGIRKAAFSWSNEDNETSTPSRRSFLLRIEEELQFVPKKINVIFGPTGSGKTSLLMALLGGRTPHS